MLAASPNQDVRWGDLILALEFAEKHVERWQKEGRFSQKQVDKIRLRCRDCHRGRHRRDRPT